MEGEALEAKWRHLRAPNGSQCRVPQMKPQLRLVITQSWHARVRLHLKEEQFSAFTHGTMTEAEERVAWVHLAHCMDCGLKLPQTTWTKGFTSTFMDNIQDARELYRAARASQRV
jgi:hypothetical protein